MLFGKSVFTLGIEIFKGDFPYFEVSYSVVSVRESEVYVQAVPLLLPDVALELLVFLGTEERQILLSQELDSLVVGLLEEESTCKVGSNAQRHLHHVLCQDMYACFEVSVGK